MRPTLCVFVWLISLAAAIILDNGHPREDPYPGQAEQIEQLDHTWKTYPPSADEISYKGRWDSQYISWWSASGIKFGFTGQKLALSFGDDTSDGVLLAYRIGGLDWQFSNVTAKATYHFVSPSTTGIDLTEAESVKNFEMRVQLAGVATDSQSELVKVPEFNKTVEIIGDSLTAGQYTSYEGLSSWAWGLVQGLGDVEYSITAYPGICLTDKHCHGNARGQTFQWYQTSDTGRRAHAKYGDHPEEWDFKAHKEADLVIIHLGTNDHNEENEVTPEQFYESYVKFIDGIHKLWPNAEIVIFSLTKSFSLSGNTYASHPAFRPEIEQVYLKYPRDGRETFVHYFDLAGILQHNDIGPRDHYTDTGHLKIASHMLQYVKLKFGYMFNNDGPEIQHDTTYWNTEESYRRL